MYGRRVAFLAVVCLIVTPLFAGTATVKLISYQNYLNAPNTQTFTLQVQPFTGSSDCTSGGGATSLVNGVGNSGYALDVAPGNSVMLTVGTVYPAFSDQNGHFVSWGVDPDDATVSSTITWGPGDGRNICVGGFTGAHDYHARFYVGIELLDECGNPRTTWAPGETVHIRVSGGLTFNGEPHRLMAAGGSVNECTFLPEAPLYATVHVTSDPFIYDFTLPDSDADIPNPGCTGSGTQHITGNWRVVTYDSPCGCNRNQFNFTVADDAPPQTPCSIDCPEDITVGNDAGQCGANVTFTPPAGATCDALSGAFFPIGTTTVTCTAGALSCDFDVTVNDEEAPSVGTIAASPNVLWSPNGQMVDVNIAYSGTDNCGPASCSIVSIASNEPDPSDYEIVDAHTVRLRAERLGTGSGRTYTITVNCGGSTGQVTVSVPHSQKKK
ncbi:MAG TPA: hypothetical protein VND45_00950 [Thermoanaerobaculia bacterium]|jgi:hypothetical protein|nr:hypothetical protein [Thermoanaerobaculia bacterium]